MKIVLLVKINAHRPTMDDLAVFVETGFTLQLYKELRDEEAPSL